VLVAGGDGANRPLSSVELYEPRAAEYPLSSRCPGPGLRHDGEKDLAISYYERFVSSNPLSRDLEILHPICCTQQGFIGRPSLGMSGVNLSAL
jgi:hypothetical protein